MGAIDAEGPGAEAERNSTVETGHGTISPEPLTGTPTRKIESRPKQTFAG